ncbi:bacteriorhodopsin-like [Spirosoma sp. RP8]|uniref:Bacteriorhodopsin-like n=1 Tax=Spirosoma liriopis TaxID=2937440 RepID=A0ABT0HFP5_9BACT|nr:bacteriorhodopsin [Spirosoma liriopis]MCK8490978.1 bacteriorhodopsin-like [Spirosoma liriopis]
MKLSDTFIPTAGVVGLLPMVTYFFLVVAMYAFLGNFLFALLSRTSVSPKHKSTQALTTIIAAVAGISYFLIQSYYRDMLAELATLADADNRQTLMRESYNAIGQYRYMDWAVTTPLLLLKMVSFLRVKLHEIKRPLAIMLLADFFMILTGYIGEQQVGFDNEVLAGPKLIWGAVSTVGYIIIPFTLYKLWKQYADRALPKEQQAYRLMALTTVTFWGVYPIGYILTVFAIDTNWIHITFSIADLINKVGVGLVAYWAGRETVKYAPH